MDVGLALKLRRPDRREELTKAHEIQKRSKLHHIHHILVNNFFKRFIFDTVITAEKEREIERQVGDEIKKWLNQNNGTVNIQLFT